MVTVNGGGVCVCVVVVINAQSWVRHLTPKFVLRGYPYCHKSIESLSHCGRVAVFCSLHVVGENRCVSLFALRGSLLGLLGPSPVQ